jgi:hypothetical protein
MRRQCIASPKNSADSRVTSNGSMKKIAIASASGR